MTFPTPVPEIPATNVDIAAAYYVDHLGFTFDWGDDKGGIAGISRGNCRLFITNLAFRESYGNTGPILFWLNLNSKAEVDQLTGAADQAAASLRAALRIYEDRRATQLATGIRATLAGLASPAGHAPA